MRKSDESPSNNNGPKNGQIVNEHISVSESKRRVQAQMQAAEKSTASPNKGFQDEILQARAGRGMPVNAVPASNGPAAVNAQEDAAARRARTEAFEARFANSAKPVVKTTQKDAVFATLSSPAHKARFQQIKASIVQKMDKDAKSKVMQLLNLEMMNIPAPVPGNIQKGPAASAAKKATTMQLIGMSNMFTSANPQSAVEVSAVGPKQSAVAVAGAVAQRPVPLHYSDAHHAEVGEELRAPQQIAFRQILDFNFLRDARIVLVPEGNEVDEANIKEKLDEFMRIVANINDDQFIDFLKEHVSYDRKLDEVKAASPRDMPRLKAEFAQLTDNFRRRFEAVIISIVEAVSNMSVLVAYLENNPAAGVAVHKALRQQYETEGRDILVQMKCVLIEKCSAKVCQALGLRDSDKDGLAEKIKETMLNQAFAQGNEQRINKFVM